MPQCNTGKKCMGFKGLHNARVTRLHDAKRNIGVGMKKKCIVICRFKQSITTDNHV